MITIAPIVRRMVGAFCVISSADNVCNVSYNMREEVKVNGRIC